MVVRGRRLAAELKQLREAARLTLEETAARLECSTSKISRIETGHVRVSPRDVRDLLRIYGVPDNQQAGLIELAREARQKGWWQAYGSLEPHLATYLGLEHEASEIRIYRVSRAPAVLPFTSRGLYSTIDGNFTIMAFPHPADPDVVCIGYPTGLLWIEDTAEVDQYNALFSRLQDAALPAEDSVAFMTSLLTDL